VTERSLILLVAVAIVAFSLLAMGAAHQTHYKNRRWQLLEGRVSSLERIIVGDHD